MLAANHDILHQNSCRPCFPISFSHVFQRIRPSTVDKQGRNSARTLTAYGVLPTIDNYESLMPRSISAEQKVLEFPTADIADVSPGANLSNALEIVISGSYRKQFESIREAYQQFRDLGCTVLSPSSVDIVNEHDGFVYMQGEETQTPEKIEDRHLNAIERADFVWLHAPEGYVGPMAAWEIGFAHAAGVPVYAKEPPKETRFRPFVRVVDAPATVVESRPLYPEPPAPALKAFQQYYRRVAVSRGYAKERPKDCLLLMVEEIGELARALRKREKLVRHGSYPESSEAKELADVFLYVVHMANVLGLDLAEIVQKKEFVNLEKFLAR